MPMLTDPLPSAKNLTPATGRAKSVEYKSAAVETRFTPIASLLTRVQGSSLTGIYYNQVVEQNDQIRPQQVGVAAPYQQYNRINKLETKLQGDLSYSVDPDTQERRLSAEVVMYPSIIPMTGDMYHFDTGDGVLMAFTVSQLEPLSWLRQTCYRLMLNAVGPVTKAMQDDLDKKTVETFTFVRDFVNHGKYPIVVDELYRSYSDLARIFKTMQSEYLRNFFSEVCQTLLVPGQTYTLYDPFLTKAVLQVLEVGSHPSVKKLNVFHLNDPAFKTTSVWDSLLNVDDSHLYVACHRMGAAHREVLYNRAAQGGAYWTQIQRVMFPLDDRQDADNRFKGSRFGQPLPLVRSEAPLTDFNRLVESKDMRSVEEVDPEMIPPGYLTPDIHRVADYDTYVFSPAFYERNPEGMSRLEKMVWALFDQEEIDVPELARLVSGSKLWDKLERFYYVPVLMVLCTVALRGPSGAS